MSEKDLKWGYPELVYGIHEHKVKIGCETKTTGEWLAMSRKEAWREWECPNADFAVYRAIIQRWHGLAPVRPEFKQGDYVVPKNNRSLGARFIKDEETAMYYDGDLFKNWKKFTEDYDYATPPEIKQFNRELAENLGLREGVKVRFEWDEGWPNGKTGIISEVNFGNGTLFVCSATGNSIFNSPVEHWQYIKPLPEKEEKQSGPTEQEILTALYEVHEKIMACEGNWERYEWSPRKCSLCLLIDDSKCKGVCPIYPCSETLHPHEHGSLTPLQSAIESAIRERGGFYVGMWVEHRDYKQLGKGIVIAYDDVDRGTKDHPWIVKWQVGKVDNHENRFLAPCDPPAEKDKAPEKAKEKKSDTSLWNEVEGRYYSDGLQRMCDAIDDLREKVERLSK